MNMHEDKVVLYYISELNKIIKQKKQRLKIVGDKPIVEHEDIDEVEAQIRRNLNEHLRKNYPYMAYTVTARVKVKSIPDGCGLENKGVILKSEGDDRLVRLDDGKQYQYNVNNLILLEE